MLFLPESVSMEEVMIIAELCYTWLKKDTIHTRIMMIKGASIQVWAHYSETARTQPQGN